MRAIAAGLLRPGKCRPDSTFLRQPGLQDLLTTL
jgi:hypothetical protein